MTPLKRNLLANFVGRGWCALMGVAFIPLYIKLMGIEAYGLIGIFTLLQGLVAVLDLGLTTTLNRELARYSASEGGGAEARDMVHTLQLIYWGIAVVIALVIVAAAPWLAQVWIKADGLPTQVVQQAVILMGLVTAFQWPLSFYGGGLLGLQRQVLYNGLLMTWSTLRFAGVVAVLWFLPPTILTFFAWQIVVSAISTTLMAVALWWSLPPGTRLPRFRVEFITSVWRFTAGISGISLLVLLLTQLDKIVLSRLLSLEMFAYYTLASVAAGGITTLISPIFATFFPTFSKLVVSGEDQLASLYHRGCQLMSIIILPIGTLLVFFSPEILLVWTGDATTVQNAYPLLTLLGIGTTLNGLMVLPYALQLAHGWTSLTFYVNLISVIFLLPFLIITTSYYGSVGAATSWLILNIGYFLIQPQFMHRRLLSKEKWAWYINDIGTPLFAVLLVVVTGRWLLGEQKDTFVILITLITILTMSFVAALLSASQMRDWLYSKISQSKVVYGR